MIRDHLLKKTYKYPEKRESMFEFISFVALAVVLGFKHSYDADHLFAVSYFLKKAQTIKSALHISFMWAVGHMITATLITLVLYYFRTQLSTTILPHFEKIVGIVLIILGVFTLKNLLVVHSHVHRHGKIIHAHPHIHSPSIETNSSSKTTTHTSQDHSHKHMLGIGVLHGFASNNELLTLLTASLGITTVGGMLVGVGAFSVGVIVGMIIFSCLFSYSLLKSYHTIIYRGILGITGTGSILYGITMLGVF